MPEEQEPFVAEDGKAVGPLKAYLTGPLPPSSLRFSAGVTFWSDGRVTMDPGVRPEGAAKELLDLFVTSGWLKYAPLWRPIATAPKDKSVLLYTPYGLMYCGRWRYGTLGEPQQDILAWRCDSSGRFADPTKWQPLPAPPEAT